jgi:hypothetical protein
MPAPSSSPGASRETGDAAVRLARRTLEELIGAPAPRDAAERFRTLALPPALEERRGVFVTLLLEPADELRGCIGFPRPVYPLRAAIPRAAYAAACEDPRFPLVTPRDLPSIVVEVSLLTVPEPMEARPRRGLVEQVKVGRDGLIIEAFGASGLLLPQVAPEQGWNARQLLEGTCEKAGLPSDAWMSPEVRVLRFEANIFRESRPRGTPVERPS